MNWGWIPAVTHEHRMSTSTPRKKRSALTSFCLWTLLALFVLAGAGVGSLYLLCTFKPELVAASVQEHLCAATGMPWQIRGVVRPVLAPYPGVTVSDVSILAASSAQAPQAASATPLAHVRKARFYLDLSSLWEFSLNFRLIELEEPTINLAYDEQNRPLWRPLPQECELPPGQPAVGFNATSPSGKPVAGFNATAPSAFSSASFNATLPPSPAASLPLPRKDSADPSLPPEAGAGEGEAADAIAEFARFLRHEEANLRLPVHIRNGSLNRYTDNGRLLLSCSNIEARLLPRPAAENFQIAARFFLPGAGLEVNFALGAGFGGEGILAFGRLSGQVSMTPPGSRAVHGDFRTSFSWDDSGRTVLMPDVVFTAEGDALSARLTADLREILCTGKVTIHRLSLPRWFEFGRLLPPGLQQALDGLVGDFDLHLDTHSAEARNLRGVVGPLLVRGYVGTPDFSAPVVVVDLDLDRANVDLLFPFLAAVGRYVPDPVSPQFDHSVLAPFPVFPGPPPPDDHSIDISYDVKVRVARPRVHDVDGGPLEVLVLPLFEKGVEKTRVSFTGGDLLTGKVEGRLDIDEGSVLMHYDAKGLKLGLLPENKENSVRIDGMITGTCDITVPVGIDGTWANDWKLESQAVITGCEITGRYDNAPWRLYAGKARASGKGSIHAVQQDGIRIEGLWDLAAQGVKTSWNPKGDDALTGKFDGGLYWPVIPDGPPPEPKVRRTVERRGVERIEGKLALNGALVVPLGSWRPSLSGRLNTGLKWLLYDETVTLSGAEFTGFGSILSTNGLVDYSGKNVEARFEADCKINAREWLRAWLSDIPKGFVPPRLITGKTVVSGTPGTLRFDKIKLEMDGAPVSGEIAWQESPPRSGDAGQWTARLTADHVDFDNLFPPPPDGQAPEPPSKTPWNLGFAKGLSLDIQLLLRNAKREKLSSSSATLTGTLQRDRFSLHGDIAGFYSGGGVILLQGTLVPEKSQVTLRKGLLQLQGMDLGKLLHDYSRDSSYGGTGDLVVDVSGVLQCNADIPAKLSGIWSLNIKDGLYPAFVGSSESTLRNTFSSAAMSGIMDRGVLRCSDFTLKGAMVDMAGSGWYDLNTRDMDLRISVTVAKVPTVPVRFYGNASAPRMRVRGVDMVVQTVQAAGSTVFGLVRGVFELPGRAVTGIGSLFGSGDKGTSRNGPSTAPVKPITAPVNPSTAPVKPSTAPVKPAPSLVPLKPAPGAKQTGKR